MAQKTKTRTKKTSKKTTVPKKMQSFRVFPDVKPFIQFKVTIQTVYWTILCLAILVLSIWILNTQMELLEIVQDIENSQ
jgi:hypothetical protein